MNKTLIIKNLSKRFPGSRKPAVQNFSLDVFHGETVALLGESGCGKTTILRIIAGFETPDTGEVWINGRLVAGETSFVDPSKRGVGIVFQDYALFPHITVWENICFGLFRLEKQERSDKASAVLNLTGLAGLEKRYPYQLSGGQKQRLALARALAPEPGIILFDEPFSNVDAIRKNQMRNDIKNILANARTTTLLVTHDTRDVMDMADRVAVIREGENQQTDTPSQLCCNPANQYVAMCFEQGRCLEP